MFRDTNISNSKRETREQRAEKEVTSHAEFQFVHGAAAGRRCEMARAPRDPRQFIELIELYTQ